MSEQINFWDEETKKDNYVKNFLRGAEINRWIEMLTNVEGKEDTLIEGKVLEIGGGSQFLSRFIATERPSNVICTDISSERISFFQEFYGEKDNLEIRGDVNAECLPFSDSEFDFIVGDAVLHHIEDLRTALLEISRCLKDDGLAIFIREPTLGIYTPLRREQRRIFGSREFESFASAYRSENRYEYCRYPVQWNEEFFRAGFKSKRYPGWYYYTFKNRVFSLFPNVFTSLSVYVLKKN